MKYRLFFILIIAAQALWAQRERPQNLKNYDDRILHFGFTIGGNSANFNMNMSDTFLSDTLILGTEINASPGFHLGPISNLRMGDYLDLRFLINLSFTQRRVTYLYAEPDFYGNMSRKMDIESVFVEFPLLLKYRSKRINNYRPYVIAGTNQKIDLGTRRKIKEEDKPRILIKPYDTYAEIGFGVDFYLEYFKFSPEIKFSQGFRNIIKPDGTVYSESVRYMNSSMIMFSLHFE